MEDRTATLSHRATAARQHLLALPHRSALVLRAPLALAAEVRPVAADLLPSADLDRAGRFVHQADRDRLILGWAVTRLVLAAALDERPRVLTFIDNGHGKKRIGRSSCSLRFNISHSGDQVLVAFSDGAEVGVDIERVRPRRNLDGIAERFFSAAERAFLFSRPADEQMESFFAIWTRKEAFIKAIGMGFRLPLDSFDVSGDPAEPARLVAVRHPRTSADSWSLSDVDVAPGYRAALVLEGGDAPAHAARDLSAATLRSLLRDLT